VKSYGMSVAAICDGSNVAFGRAMALIVQSMSAIFLEGT
jgi:hypothetical protein